MHEMSIASSLLEQVIGFAQQNEADGIGQVEIQAGSLCQIVPEMMQTAWQSIIVDTIAKDSELVITELKAKAKCNACGNEFEPALNDYTCPQCKVADADIIQGDDIILMSLDLQIGEDDES